MLNRELAKFIKPFQNPGSIKAEVGQIEELYPSVDFKGAYVYKGIVLGAMYFEEPTLVEKLQYFMEKNNEHNNS